MESPIERHKMKAVELLNEMIVADGSVPPPPLPAPLSNQEQSPPTALKELTNIIGEVEAVTSHDDCSVKKVDNANDTPVNDSRRTRISVRRGASREIAATISGDLKRPEDNNENKERRDSRLRRGASQDLASTITGDLKRPDDDVNTTALGNLKRSESIPEEDFQSALSSKVYADDAVTVNMLDLRVGKILHATKHESAEKLYCESIDVGEPEPRSIASGLVPYYSLEEMQGRMVVVVCNLKPRNFFGFPSNGMVLCATSLNSDTDERIVELLTPPTAANPGDRVFAAGVPGEALTPQKCDKKKIYPKVAADLKVNENGSLSWDGVVLRVGDLPFNEFCSVPGLRNSEVS